MADFYRTSATWVVDYRYDGRRRTKYEVIRNELDARSFVLAKLLDLYGTRAQLESLRPATEDEERAFLRGDEPKNVFCPIGHAGPPADGKPRDSKQ